MLRAMGKRGVPRNVMYARSYDAVPGTATCTAFLPLKARVVSSDTVPPANVSTLHIPPGFPGAMYESKLSQTSAAPHASGAEPSDPVGASFEPPSCVPPPPPSPASTEPPDPATPPVPAAPL